MGGSSSKMAEEMAQREKERMAIREAELRMEMRAEREAQRCIIRMAIRRARLRMIRQGDFSSSEKKLVVSAVEKWIKSLDDQRAERRARVCMKRWVDFGSDVSAVKDFNKLLDDLRAVRRAWLRMEREAPFCPCDDFHLHHLREALFCPCDDFHLHHLGRALFCPCDDFHRPPHLIWWEIPSTVKKLVVSAVDDWINSLDDQFTGMATRSKKSIPIRYSSLPRQGDFYLSEKEHDVSDDKDLVKSPDELRAERRAWLRNKMRATGSLESNDSDVSLKSDQSKGGLIDFKDRVSPRPDFSSSEEEDVSDDEDLVESPDDQWGEIPSTVKKLVVSAVDDWINSLDDQEEMNQELSSEVGWKHLEAPVSSCT